MIGLCFTYVNQGLAFAFFSCFMMGAIKRKFCTFFLNSVNRVFLAIFLVLARELFRGFKFRFLRLILDYFLYLYRNRFSIFANGTKGRAYRRILRASNLNEIIARSFMISALSRLLTCLLSGLSANMVYTLFLIIAYVNTFVRAFCRFVSMDNIGSRAICRVFFRALNLYRASEMARNIGIIFRIYLQDQENTEERRNYRYYRYGGAYLFRFLLFVGLAGC